jgi:single-stranded DNA-binding protein
MNITVITGIVSHPPETKTSQKGNAYSVFTIKSKNPFGYDSYVKIYAFGKMVEKIAGLQPGDLVCATGESKTEAYTKGNEPKAILIVAASNIEILVKAPL